MPNKNFPAPISRDSKNSVIFDFVFEILKFGFRFDLENDFGIGQKSSDVKCGSVVPKSRLTSSPNRNPNISKTRRIGNVVKRNVRFPQIDFQRSFPSQTQRFELIEKEIVDSAISTQIEFREIWQILDQHQSSYVRQAIVRNSDEFENFETFDSGQMHQSSVGDFAGVTEIEVLQVLHRDEFVEAVVVDEGLPLAASQVEVGQTVAVGR
jgi:hypothetical protein